MSYVKSFTCLIHLLFVYLMVYLRIISVFRYFVLLLNCQFILYLSVRILYDFDVNDVF